MKAEAADEGRDRAGERGRRDEAKVIVGGGHVLRVTVQTRRRVVVVARRVVAEHAVRVLQVVATVAAATRPLVQPDGVGGRVRRTEVEVQGVALQYAGRQKEIVLGGTGGLEEAQAGGARG